MAKVASMADVKRKYMFINMTRHKSKKEIEKIERNRGKKLSKQAKMKIIKRNARKAKIYTTIAITFLAIGGISGYKATNLLDSGKTEISIDANKYKEGIDITNTTSDREIFLNGLHVELNEVNINEQIEENAITEINNLKNSDEVLKYIKQIYLDEYKQRFGGNVTIDNIRLYKERNVALYKDVAQNGDEIIRKGFSKTNEKLDSEIGVLSATVKDGDKTYMEDAILDRSSYKNVYAQNENVAQDTETILQDIGAVIEHGIDYYSGFVDKDESDIYKDRLINAVIDYKHSKIEKIVEPSNKNTDKTLEDDNEIDY